MRLVVGMIIQETNSFSSVSTSIQSFKDVMFLEGDEIPLKLKRTNTEVAGFMDRVCKEKCDSVYTLATSASSSGPVQREALDFLLSRLLNQLEKAGIIDGVYLICHGSMLVDKIPDGTGHVLQVVREKIGLNIPIVVSLDLHANLTPLIIESADALVAYRTFPHRDFREVGSKATDILIQIIKGEIIPEIAFCKIPMLIPPEIAHTDKEPTLKLIKKIKEIEAQPEVVTAGFLHVQPWLDIPNTGCSTFVVTDRNKKMAKKRSEELATLFWSLRNDFEPDLVPVRKAIQKAMNAPEGPIILLDSADTTSSGASGDTTVVLEALLDMKVSEPAYTTVVDPEVVDVAIKAGVGNTISVSLGGKRDRMFSHPIEVIARVKSISDGVFKFKSFMSTGVEQHMGRAVVLVKDKVYIVVMELPVHTADPALYQSVGLEPKDAKIVVVKCCVAAYDEIAKEVIFLDTPGASSPRISHQPFSHRSRPLYPFEDVEQHECKEKSYKGKVI